ncbi:Lrp/AsnC family transcriptional regulator [Pseudonocardia acaciae]|uniref:Lrp/AsnC family transcriptional regulator n=1 Tax=Pseudonocardia acaciae TaxID=551276 RepID=UPI00048BE4F2|nr:Lrp/AsnC family transcriptional regulator [Pseudonocardia acaciae]
MPSPSTQESAQLSELDLCIVNALQVVPRAPWSLIGETLDIDPVTVARRWESLHRRGAAWVSARPLEVPARSVALVEIECRSGHGTRVADELARDPHVRTIDITAGGRDLVVTVTSPDVDGLTWYLLDGFASLPSVSRVRSQLLVDAYTDARPWRLRSLSPDQLRILDEHDERGAVPTPRHHPTDWAIAAALSSDGRLPVATLAQRTGVSLSTARRRLGNLLRSRRIRLRCELARCLSGWPVLAWFFARVPSEHVDRTGRALARLPEARLVASTVGPYNMMFSVWLRSVRQVQDLEARIVREHPHVGIVDRSVVIHQYKLAGRLLDRAGLSVGVVPLPTSQRV